MPPSRSQGFWSQLRSAAKPSRVAGNRRIAARPIPNKKESSNLDQPDERDSGMATLLQTKRTAFIFGGTSRQVWDTPHANANRTAKKNGKGLPDTRLPQRRPRVSAVKMLIRPPPAAVEVTLVMENGFRVQGESSHEPKDLGPVPHRIDGTGLSVQ